MANALTAEHRAAEISHGKTLRGESPNGRTVCGGRSRGKLLQTLSPFGVWYFSVANSCNCRVLWGCDTSVWQILVTVESFWGVILHCGNFFQPSSLLGCGTSVWGWGFGVPALPAWQYQAMIWGTCLFGGIFRGNVRFFRRKIPWQNPAGVVDVERKPVWGMSLLANPLHHAATTAAGRPPP